jgi:predicted GNAT superfamily acetyltransferase
MLSPDAQLLIEHTSEVRMNRPELNQPEVSQYELRDLTRAEDLELLEDIQKDAWGYNDREVTPGSLMVASVHSGGIVVGAYPNNSDIPVGFAYSFAAVKGPKSWQHSHMLAIRPEHRGTGLATALKLRQRERALELGFTLMTWTFDPLIARNARLNLGKLGARAVAYHPDWYALRGGIYAGLPADRFMVEWHLAQPSKDHPAPKVDGPRALERMTSGLFSELGLGEKVVFVEVPRDIEALKRTDLPLAKAWRQAHREVFGAYFKRGFIATDLAFDGERTFYRLEKV